MPRRPALRTRVRKVVELWIESFDEHELLTHASAIAFQVLKSLIPLSLLEIALLGEVGRRDIWATHLAPAIRPRFDPPVFGAIDFAVTKIFLHDSVPLIVLAGLLTVWYVSRSDAARRGANSRRGRALAGRDRGADRGGRAARSACSGQAPGEAVGECGRRARGRHLDRDLDRLPLVCQLDREFQDGGRPADRISSCCWSMCMRPRLSSSSVSSSTSSSVQTRRAVSAAF
jgi:hypothetical protein